MLSIIVVILSDDEVMETLTSKMAGWIEGVPADDVRPASKKARADQMARMLYNLITIDPPGFALENFDPVGGWRTN